MSDRWYAVDASVAVPLVMRAHEEHTGVAEWATDKTLCLSGHAAAETYSVLTRLPIGIRTSPSEAAQVIDATFVEVLTLPTNVESSIHNELAYWGICGGAVYDALVGLAARERSMTLVTRDARAIGTYQSIGVDLMVLALRD